VRRSFVMWQLRRGWLQGPGWWGDDEEWKVRVDMPWRRAASETRERGGDHGRVEWSGEAAELKFRV
jgi:hypothetical protein